MSQHPTQHGIWNYLKSKAFFKQVLFIFGIFFLLLLLTQMWLRFYTNHGQKLQLPKYIGMHIDEARESTDGDFELVVIDSIFIVGKPGGLITDQNPKPLSLVKENRKIYITVTKYGIESVKVADLPTLYGNAYDQKRTELKYRDIECIIKDYVYDNGEPNHILEVWYNNELIISRDVKKSDVTIAKGGKLEFVISKRDGGDVTIPDLRCKTLEEVEFLLSSSKLLLGDVTKKSVAEPDAILYVVGQSPPYDGISNIKMGEKINITLSATKPVDCK